MDKKSSSRHRESVSSKASGRETTACAVDVSSFRPLLVTNFGEYTLAYLSSMSRDNYLALWGPEVHVGITSELSMEDARVSVGVISECDCD
jgi:hypothetical protein